MKSLQSSNHPLAQSKAQMALLEGGGFADGTWPRFADTLKSHNAWPLRSGALEIFQLNVGYMCNQICKHCHVDAGPDRKEIMTRETMEQCLVAIAKSNAHTVDLTGGAPEMNPNFRWFVEEIGNLGKKEIIVRCNLTILLANIKYNDLPEFFAKHRIHVVSSLPFYTGERTDKQRGEGVFTKSIEALRMLNAVGYGHAESGLLLDLVYNPSGAFLPGNQSILERDFKAALQTEYSILFNRLFAIANMPIRRYLDYLVASENYEDYMDTLVSAFNPQSISNLMCRNTISVGWDGKIYDCDFNQMLDLNAAVASKHIGEWNPDDWHRREIVVSGHCYGCTAGEGSSCQGSLNP